MSFGFSPSDVVSAVQLAARVYQGWKRACGEYSKVTGELETLETILSRVAFEVQRPTSLLGYHDGDLKKLQKIITNCTDVVNELETVLSKYGNLRFSRRSNWDRIKFGNKDMSGLRERLKLQINALGTYLSVLGISSLGRIEDNIKLLPEMRMIIDNLAADIRAGRREGSVMTTYDNDRKEVWRQFRRELISEGIQSDKIELVKHHLRSYLKRLNEAGLMDEEVPEEIRGLDYTPTEKQDLGNRYAHEKPQSKPSPRPVSDFEESERESEVAEDNTSPPRRRLLEYHINNVSSEDQSGHQFDPLFHPDLALPMGWHRMLDPENRFFYVDMLAGKGNKKCFWQPPIPEQYPNAQPPLGWKRIQTVTGRLFWLHSSSGLKSYEYPGKSKFIICQDGEPTHAFIKGFTTPQDISSLPKFQLELQEEGTACQMHRMIWEDPFFFYDRIMSEGGRWCIHMITSNCVLLKRVTPHRSDSSKDYQLRHSELPTRRVNYERDITLHRSRPLLLHCKLHMDSWQMPSTYNESINESNNLRIQLSSKIRAEPIWVSEVKFNKQLHHPIRDHDSSELIAAFENQIRTQIGNNCSWEPCLSSGTRLSRLRSKLDKLKWRDYDESRAIPYQLRLTIELFKRPWNETALRYGPLGKLYTALRGIDLDLSSDWPLAFRAIEELDRDICALPGDWQGTDICSRRLLCVRDKILRARKWFFEECYRRIDYLWIRAQIFDVLIAEYQGHLKQHCGSIAEIESVGLIRLEDYNFNAYVRKRLSVEFP